MLLVQFWSIYISNKKERMVDASIVFKYFPSLSADKRDKIEALYDIYEHWNNQINVISRKDFENFYERHVLHSLGIAKVKNFNNGERVIDVGTGGGFPGVPLAILFPETEFVLCDSIGKKITVVKEVCKSLNLKNVTTIHARSEDLKGKYDAMVSRAVTRLAPFYQMTKHLVDAKHANIIYLKGGALEEELTAFTKNFPKKKIKKKGLPLFFKEPFFETKYVVKIV